jgi:hypothetical protein
MATQNASHQHQVRPSSERFPLAHTVIPILNYRSSSNFTLWPRKSDHRSLLFFCVNYPAQLQQHQVCLTVALLLKRDWEPTGYKWRTTRHHFHCYRSWLRHYATSRNITGSFPDEVIGFVNWLNPSSCTMTLGSTQPLTEMSTRNLSGGE